MARAPSGRRIAGDEAVAHVVRNKNDPLAGLMLREPYETGSSKFYTRRAVLHGLHVTIAHALFPQHFPEPVATRLRKGQPPALATRFVETTPQYRRAVKEFYLHRKITSAFGPIYGSRLDSETGQLNDVLSAISKAGITVQCHPVNIGFKDDGRQTPVFFEVRSIDCAMAREYVRTLGPEGSRRGRMRRNGILGAIDELERQEQL